MRLQDVGELGVLRQEPVAGMDRVGARDLAGGHDLVDVQVAFARGRRADADALVGQPYMHGVGIRRGMNRNRRDAEFLAGAKHPERDLAAIGDEDLLKHRALPAYSITTSGSPYSTGCASLKRMAVTVPERGEGIWFIVFIASMMSSVWPSRTVWPTSTNGLASGEGDA